MSTCPTCGGAGVVDTSPAAAARAPWLEEDATCPTCGGTSETTREAS